MHCRGQNINDQRRERDIGVCGAKGFDDQVRDFSISGNQPRGTSIHIGGQSRTVGFWTDEVVLLTKTTEATPVHD